MSASVITASVITASGGVKDITTVVVGNLLLGDGSDIHRVTSTSVKRGVIYRVVPSVGEAYDVLSSQRLSLISIHPTITAYAKYGKTCVRWVRDFTLHEQWFRGITGPPYDEAFSFYTDLIDDPERVDVPVVDYIAWSNDMKELYMGYRVAVTWPSRYVSEQRYDPYTVGMWYGKSISTDTFSRPSFMVHSASTTSESDRELLSGTLPMTYISGSLNIRQEVLAGIIDMLGHNISKRAVVLSIQGTMADSMLDSVLFIARSLGICTSYSTLRSGYQLFLEGDILATLPFRLISKLIPSYRIGRPPQGAIVDRYLFNIYLLGEGESTTIELESSGRYLLDDFTVVHT